MKKKVIIIFLILVITFSIVKLYQTFAIDTSVSNASEDIYEVTLNNSTYNVNVPANSSKTIIYKLTNTNQGTVKYGVAYSGTNITVRIYSDSVNPETGNINYLDNKFIKLYVSNSGSTDSTATITTIMGFENGGDLIVPSDVTLVTEKYPTLTLYIKNLYNANTTAVNNSITYNLDSTNNLMEDTAGNIRYYGASPSNYVYFNCETYPETNCELWRIIGVFGNKIKIIRNESIGTYSWDNKNESTGAETVDGKNDWTTARLMKLLNPSDYYTIDANDNGLGQSLYYNSGSGTCYSGQNNATTSCDFTSTGLKNYTTRNMIAEVTWNLGGWNTASGVYPNQIYEYERGTTVYSGRPTTWTGKIALMYPSDYGYATDFTKCTKDPYNYNSSDDSYACRANDWLYNSAVQWLLTTDSSNAYNAWVVNSTGNVIGGLRVYNAYARGIRPVLYLNSGTGIVSGSGTQADPYRIS